MPNYLRPTAMNQPQTLGLHPSMVAPQRRAAIATGGVAGGAGTFRDQSAQDFYKNIFLRHFNHCP